MSRGNPIRVPSTLTNGWPPSSQVSILKHLTILYYRLLAVVLLSILTMTTGGLYILIWFWYPKVKNVHFRLALSLRRFTGLHAFNKLTRLDLVTWWLGDFLEDHHIANGTFDVWHFWQDRLNHVRSVTATARLLRLHSGPGRRFVYIIIYWTLTRTSGLVHGAWLTDSISNSSCSRTGKDVFWPVYIIYSPGQMKF